MNTAAHDLSVDMETLKRNQKAAWEDGSYAHFAKFMEDGAIEVLESWNIPLESQLLDVACGSGQTAIPAAKKGIKVTGIDIAENLIAYARKRAVEANLDSRFDVGDAEDLPYDDKSFDVVISMFGAMFAPDPSKVSNEFARVLKPGGKLYMANWTPGSMPAQMFGCVSEFLPPPAGIIPPVLWGDASIALQRLNPHFTDIQLTRRIYPQWHYPFNADELANLFIAYFGPVKRVFEKLGDTRKEFFKTRLAEIYRANSEEYNGILTITGGEYLEVIATRR